MCQKGQSTLKLCLRWLVRKQLAITSKKSNWKLYNFFCLFKRLNGLGRWVCHLSTTCKWQLVCSDLARTCPAGLLDGQYNEKLRSMLNFNFYFLVIISKSYLTNHQLIHTVSVNCQWHKCPLNSVCICIGNSHITKSAEAEILWLLFQPGICKYPG